MRRRRYFMLALLLAFFVSPLLYAQHGSGGGHSGGYFSSGGFSGRSFGSSAGHSFGHMFGLHSGGHRSPVGKAPGSRGDELPPLAGAAFIHGKVMMLPGPTSAGSQNEQPRHPRRSQFTAAAGPHRRFRAKPFDAGLCDPSRFTWQNVLFPDDVDCFGAPFFAGLGSGEPDKSSTALDSAGIAAQDRPSASCQDAESSACSPVKMEPPVTLLQLRDGSMYGLTRFWIKDGRLYYVTDYGGENSVPMHDIDFAKTSQLNMARGTPLILPAEVPEP